MKHNLKNRPRKLVTKHSSIVYLSNQKAGAVEEWFDGFEKELREALVHWENAKKKHPWAEDYSLNVKLLKEILGESEEAKP